MSADHGLRPGERALAGFDHNIARVRQLMQFDRTLLESVVSALDVLVARQKAATRPIPPQFDAEPTHRMVANIRTNDSLRPYYSEMLNQCAVLAVSYFASAVRALYIEHVAAAYDFIMSDGLFEAELKVTVGELSLTDAEDLPTKVAEVLANRSTVSFQDMKSIARLFNDHLDYEPPKDSDVNNIIVAQACRHSVVHSGGIIDDRLQKQVAGTTPRTLFPMLGSARLVQFTPPDIELTMTSMRTYLHATHNGIDDGVYRRMHPQGPPVRKSP